MSDETRDPELDDLALLVVDLVLERIRGSEIGQVTSYDAVRQTVSVQPVVARSRILETGDRQVKPPAQIHDALVVFPGGGGVRDTWPLRAGDYGLILFSSVSLSRWRVTGGVVDPGDDRRHQESDAVFLPGLHVVGHTPTPAPTDARVIHAGDEVIRLGAPSGTQPTLKADAFLEQLDTLVQAIADALTGMPGGVGAAAGAAVHAALLVFQGLVRATYKTTKVEVI